MLHDPATVIPEGRDIWGLIIKNGILEQKRSRDDFDRIHVKWTGLQHLKNMRLACKPMCNSLSRVDLDTNDFFRSTSLRGVLNFKKCFPNTKSSFRIRQMKYGDVYGEIYLDHNLSIISMTADGAIVYPIDTAEGNQFKYDVTSYRGLNVIRSSFFKETLQMILSNNGLPEGIDGFLYETCIYSDATDEGIDQFSVFINGRLDFDTIRAQQWGKDLVYAETAEETARRNRGREAREENSGSESSDE